MPSSRTGQQRYEYRTDEGRLSSSRIIEIGLMFTSLSLLLALALLILSWLAGTADACPLWAEDSRAPGPASLTPSRPIVLRRLRWKGADTPLPLGTSMPPCWRKRELLMQSFSIFPGGKVHIHVRPLHQNLSNSTILTRMKAPFEDELRNLKTKITLGNISGYL